MRVAMLAALSLGLAVPGATVAVAQQILPEDPMAGASVFVQKQCSLCHSIRANDLTSRQGPNLGSIHLKGSLLDVAGVLWNHAPGMMQKMAESRITPPRFTAREMANLIAFLTAYQYYLQQVGKPADAAAGAVVWNGKCAICHSFEVDWNKPGPSLRSYKNVSPIQMAQAMWNHGPEMVRTMSARHIAIPRFSGDEMLDLIAYARSEIAPSDEETYVQPGNPNRGALLFKEKRCASCHRVWGEGDGNAPDLGRQKELLQDVSHVAGVMWNHAVQMWGEMQKRAIPIPRLNDSEMADIIAYLYLINYYDRPGDPVRGATLFEERKCGLCHRPTGAQGVGPNLATKQNLDTSTEMIAEMWNHIPQMSQKMQEIGQVWPRINPGEMNDLVAYLLQVRKGSLHGGSG